MIVAQMLRLFRERGCEVEIVSDDPGDRDRYDARVLPPPVPIWPVRGKIPLVPLTLGAALTLAAPAHAAASVFGGADLCVSAGGGYLYEDGSATSRINLVRRLAMIRAARHSHTPVVLFSQSIGPFAARAAVRLAGHELRKADLVIARDQQSLEACRRMGVQRPLLRDDVALSIVPVNGEDWPMPLGQRVLGVTVLGELPGVGSSKWHRYRRALRDGIVDAVRASGHAVAVISHVTAHGGDTDEPVSRDLVADLRAAGCTAEFVDLGTSSDETVSGFYGQLDVLVASRLHSGILALCAGVPVIGIGYLPKTRGVLSRLRLEHRVIDVSRLSAAALAGQLAAVLEDLPAARAEVTAGVGPARVSAVRAVDDSLAVLGMQTPSPVSVVG